MLRTFTVHCNGTLTHTYSGFDMNPVGAYYELHVLEMGPFYSDEKNLALAICELHRYGKEQYGWTLPSVQVLPLPPALESQKF